MSLTLERTVIGNSSEIYQMYFSSGKQRLNKMPIYVIGVFLKGKNYQTNKPAAGIRKQTFFGSYPRRYCEYVKSRPIKGKSVLAENGGVFRKKYSVRLCKTARSEIVIINTRLRNLTAFSRANVLRDKSASNYENNVRESNRVFVCRRNATLPTNVTRLCRRFPPRNGVDVRRYELKSTGRGRKTRTRVNRL